MLKVKYFSKGFTLLELLLVISILAILAVAGAGSYHSYGKNVQIVSIARSISADLKQAQSKAMVGEGGFKWGIHFVNNIDNYYEIFSTPDIYMNASTTVIAKTALPTSIPFFDPSAGMSKDIIFNKISGITTATSVSLISGGIIKTINIYSLGTIDD